MKFKSTLNILFVIAGLLALASCAKETLDNPYAGKSGSEIDRSAPTFTAGISDSDDTKTGIDSNKKIFWTNDDRVSVFASTVDNLQYAFTGETGSRSGVLQKIADGASPSGDAIGAKYAVYPYSASTSISKEGVLSVNLPAIQTYSASSFGPGANIMAAVSTGNSFNFKNAGCYLNVRLYGDATVRKVVLTSTNGEKLSGEGTITFNNGAPVLTMGAGASTSVTLDCGNGVKLSKKSKEAIDFWFVLPPVTFNQGFTVQVVCEEGSFAKQKITSGSIGRNNIITVSPFKVATSAGQYLGKLSETEEWDIDKIKEIAEEEVEDYDKYKTLINTALTLASGLIQDDILLSRIIYTTTDPSGNVVEASGIVAFPESFTETSIFGKKTKYDKMVSLQHITWGIEDAPSTSEIPYEAAAAFKKGNDVVVLADYLGYGTSQTGDLQHPYIHNSLTGTACADLIDAAQDFVAEEGLEQDSDWEIELIGYSQGGAATISTLLELEKRGYSNIGDVYAGGSPLDLPILMNNILQTKTYSYSGFIPYLVRGMVYGDRLDVDYHNIFAPEIFTNGLFEMFSTDDDVNDWHDDLGSDVTKILHSDFFVDEFNGNADIVKVYNALKNNSCSNYTPKNTSKIKLYHSPNDNTICYDSAKKAADNWGISINDLEKESHTDGAIEFFCRYASETLWDFIKDYI